MHVLALDVGTSSIKSAILDTDTLDPVGEIHRVDYELRYPDPDAVEIDPGELWSAFTESARKAMRGVEHIDGIGLSCLMPALILLGEDDVPLGAIRTHLDRRARPSARQVQAAVGERLLAEVGNRPLPGGISAVCYREWLKEEPYLGTKTRHYLHLNGWLAYRLTGELAFDPANAGFTGLYTTLTDQEWSQEWCDYFEIEREWLPPVKSGDATLGPLLSSVASELSAPPGVPVKMGTADTSSGMLAAGFRPGDLMHSVGTTQVLATFVDEPSPDPKRMVRPYGVGDRMLHVTHNPVGGVALEWMHQLCFRDQSPEELFDKTVFEAIDRETRVSLDPPFLGGDRMEIEAHRAAFRDLTLSTDRMDLLAATLQEMRRQHHLAVRGLGVGEHFERVILTGGGADWMLKLIPEYERLEVKLIEEGALRGVGVLFREEGETAPG